MLCVWNRRFVRDISIDTDDDSVCDSSIGVGAWLNVTDASSGEVNCWQHVQGDTLNVYDFSYWSLRYIHPGNDIAMDADKPNPINAFAEAGMTRLHFPAWHTMTDYWDEGIDDLTLIGRLGDTIDFKNMPSDVQTTNIATLVGALGSRSNDGFEACGSPGEVENDPSLGFKYTMLMSSLYESSEQGEQTDQYYSRTNGKNMMWVAAALGGDDQLRQRVAWALAQIFVIGVEGVSKVRNALKVHP